MTFDPTRPPAPPRAERAAHDTQTPPNLVAFMLKDWKTGPRKPVKPLRNVANFAARRDALSKRFPGELLVFPNGHLKVRANDEHYPFRAASDFYYLTGNQEPDCVLVMVPEKGVHRAVLFVEPNPGKTDASFFTDRVKGELWEGARLGVPESTARYGIADTRPIGDLAGFLRDAATAHAKKRVARGHSAAIEAAIGVEGEARSRADRELAETLSEMRLIKDKEEIAEMRAVIASTKRGFEDVIRRLKTAKSEREIEGVFFTRARMEGNCTGYNTIAASGAHACTLHWRKNDGAIKKGDLFLLDAGVEGHSLYTADITRVLPVSGRFSREQRAIYDLVLAAQRAALAEVKPGNDFMEPNRAAMRVLAHGLEDLKILPMPAEEALRDENQFHKRYSLHNVSHMLGLDVHDCAQARAEAYKFGKLVPGMVLTVEPGLYFQPDDQTVPARYRGIGVRIEDDVVVTKKGHDNLSASIPSTASDVEKWMKTIWSARARA